MDTVAVSQCAAGAMACVAVEGCATPNRLAGTVTVGGRTGVGAIVIDARWVAGRIEDHIDTAVNMLRRIGTVDQGTSRRGVIMTLLTADVAGADVSVVAVGIGRTGVAISIARIALVGAVTVTAGAIKGSGSKVSVRIVLRNIAEVAVAVTEVSRTAVNVDATIDVQTVVSNRGVVRNR